LELGLGGDGLYMEILRDETVLRLKELGKVSLLADRLLFSYGFLGYSSELSIRFTSSRYGESRFISKFGYFLDAKMENITVPFFFLNLETVEHRTVMNW
jgi:hypothetical protein